MKSFTLQIKNQNIIAKEQQVSPESHEFFKKLFSTVGVLDGRVIVQVQAGTGVPNGVNELELRLSTLTGNYNWKDLVSIIEVYGELPKRLKRMLTILADYKNEEAEKLTGYTSKYLNKLRRQLYERIDVEGKRAHHHKNDLKEFCRALMAAGVELIVWTPEMKKK